MSSLHCTVLSLGLKSTKSVSSRPWNKLRSRAMHTGRLSMLSSPLRRCSLTKLVLPKDFMIQFKLVKLSDSSNSGMILSPTSILHPRFTEAVPGKGTWLTCSKDALDIWSSKGSFKRVSSRATLPRFTAQQVESQLARRVLQEAELLAERVKSASRRLPSGQLRPCVIAQLSTYKQGLPVDGLNGLQPLAVLDFRPMHQIGAKEPDRTAVETRNRQPLYFILAELIPASISITPAANDSENKPKVLDSIRAHLQKVIDVYNRRGPSVQKKGTQSASANPQDDERAQPASVESSPASLYALLPIDPAQETLGSDVFTPFLIALHRLRLWHGKKGDSDLIP